MRRKNNYLNNENLVRMAKECHEKNTVTREMADAILLLAKRVMKAPKFVRYSYRDEMECEAIVQMCAAVPKIDLTKSENVFAYFTMIATNAAIRVLNKEKRQQEVRDDLLEDAGAEPSFSRQMEKEFSRPEYGGESKLKKKVGRKTKAHYDGMAKHRRI